MVLQLQALQVGQANGVLTMLNHLVQTFREQEFLGTAQHRLYIDYVERLRAELPDNGADAVFPAPDAQYSVRRAEAVWERARRPRPTTAQVEAAAVNQAQHIRNQICGLIPKVRYWGPDLVDLFDLLPTDIKLPSEPNRASDRDVLQQQLARLHSAIDRSREMPAEEQRIAYLEMALSRLRKRVDELEEAKKLEAKLNG